MTRNSSLSSSTIASTPLASTHCTVTLVEQVLLADPLGQHRGQLGRQVGRVDVAGSGIDGDTVPAELVSTLTSVTASKCSLTYLTVRNLLSASRVANSTAEAPRGGLKQGSNDWPGRLSREIGRLDASAW